jgi:hypothetical protein
MTNWEPADGQAVADADAAVLDAAGVQALGVGREHLQQQVLDDDRQPEGDQHRRQRVGAAQREVQHPVLEQPADAEHQRHHHRQRPQRVDGHGVDDRQGDERGHDRQVAVGQVDQPHHPEHQRQPGGEQRVQAAEQQPLDDDVDPGHADRIPK